MEELQKDIILNDAQKKLENKENILKIYEAELQKIDEQIQQAEEDRQQALKNADGSKLTKAITKKKDLTQAKKDMEEERDELRQKSICTADEVSKMMQAVREEGSELIQQKIDELDEKISELAGYDAIINGMVENYNEAMKMIRKLFNGTMGTPQLQTGRTMQTRVNHYYDELDKAMRTSWGKH